jgi:hypothetical protein
MKSRLVMSAAIPSSFSPGVSSGFVGFAASFIRGGLGVLFLNPFAQSA